LLKFVEHLDSKKRVLRYGVLEGDGVVASQISNLLESTHAFLTNLPLSKLIEHRLDPKSLRKRFPKLVYTLCTPRGVEFSENGRSGMGAWFAASGFTRTTTVNNDLTRPLPLQFAQTHTSFSVAAGTTLALLHQLRTGEGQFCECSQLAAAAFSQNIRMAVEEANNSRVNVSVSVRQSRVTLKNQTIPCCNSFRTKDGFWIQLLGIDYAKLLISFCRVLGIKWTTIGHLVATIVYSKVSKNINVALQTVFSLNNDFAAVIASLTRKEVENLLVDGFKGEKWYCFVRDPLTARNCEQVKELRIFQTSGHAFEVKSPLSLKYEQEIKINSKL